LPTRHFHHIGLDQREEVQLPRPHRLFKGALVDLQIAIQEEHLPRRTMTDPHPKQQPGGGRRMVNLTREKHLERYVSSSNGLVHFDLCLGSLVNVMLIHSLTVFADHDSRPISGQHAHHRPLQTARPPDLRLQILTLWKALADSVASWKCLSHPRSAPFSWTWRSTSL
jgi:hypothetical protein